MGEIGIPRHEFLHVLRWWEIRCIIRGSGGRHRHAWSIARWQTFHLMACSGVDLKNAGINRPSDLIKFPWDTAYGDIPTDEDVEDLKNEIESYNQNPQQR